MRTGLLLFVIALSARAEPVRPSGPPVPPTSAKLTFTAASEDARRAVLACGEALHHERLDLARARCAQAVKIDGEAPLAHLWLAEAAATSAEAQGELERATALSGKASDGERLLVAVWRARREGRIADARRGYDDLVRQHGIEPRVWLDRARFRQGTLGDLEGALADGRKAISLDAKWAPAYLLLGQALAEHGKMDEAVISLERYAELMPAEARAHDALAMLALRNGDLAEAIAEAKRALALDSKFVLARATLGDALLFSGKLREARREWALLEASDDPAVRRAGVSRAARGFLFEDRPLEAEKRLLQEAERSLGRKALVPAAAIFLEAARIQIERHALGEAARGLQRAAQALQEFGRPEKAEPIIPSVDQGERRRLVAELVRERAMLLAALGEREFAELRAGDFLAEVKRTAQPRGEARADELRGWIAFRAGDDKAAIAALDKAVEPSLRLIYAQALERSGDAGQARLVFDELARLTVNDLETALARPRAAAWLKQVPGAP